MLAILLGTYSAVFLAEIVGDKLRYTTGVLATRYRTAPIVVGMALAYMAKMGVAVAVGQAISRLPRPLVAAITAASFGDQRHLSIRYGGALLLRLGVLGVLETLLEHRG